MVYKTNKKQRPGSLNKHHKYPKKRDTIIFILSSVSLVIDIPQQGVKGSQDVIVIS